MRDVRGDRHGDQTGASRVGVRIRTECSQTPGTGEKPECADRGTQTHQGRLNEHKSTTRHAAEKLKWPEREVRSLTKARQRRTAELSASNRSQNTGKYPRRTHSPRSVETKQLAPSAASLAKLAFKEEEKKWSMFTEEQNLSLLLQTHSKRTLKDVFYCRKKQNDLKRRTKKV